jgi:hypothetical protein
MNQSTVVPPITTTGSADPDVFCSRAEWKITNISNRLRECPKGTSLWSPEFTAAGLRGLQLEFFPSGRESATMDGFCSVFFWCPEGTNIKYQLFVGGHCRAPDEDQYEARMGHGHSNFCLLSNEISPDDSVTIGVEILDVRKEINYGSGLRVVRPPMNKILGKFLSVGENRSINKIDWRITKIGSKIKSLPRGASLYSPVFSAGGVRDMLIEFYPNGNANTQRDGFCSLYLRCPEGTQIVVTLTVGEVKKGPITARFDGPAGKGLPEFCELRPQINQADDSLTISIEIKNPNPSNILTI